VREGRPLPLSGYADFCTEIFGMLCVSTEIFNLLTPSRLSMDQVKRGTLEMREQVLALERVLP
jgi:hypothetical protein